MDIKYQVVINGDGYNELKFAFDKATSAFDFARVALIHTEDNAKITVRMEIAEEEADA